MYIFYLELYRTSIGAIWILQLRALLGQKVSISPGCPSLQRFQKRRNLSAIVYSPVFFDSYKFQLDLQPVFVLISAFYLQCTISSATYVLAGRIPVLGPCVSLPWKPFIYSVHTGMPLAWYLTPTRKGMVLASPISRTSFVSLSSQDN